MTPADHSIDLLAAQECESLTACLARGQTPDTYQDIVAKLRGHCDKLSSERRAFWAEGCKTLGVELYPPPPPEPSKKSDKSPKPEASSKP